jgi:hypothetical protein
MMIIGSDIFSFRRAATAVRATLSNSNYRAKNAMYLN